MNSAKKRLEQRIKRQDRLADTIGWLCISIGVFLGGNIMLKALQIFFSLQGIH